MITRLVGGQQIFQKADVSAERNRFLGNLFKCLSEGIWEAGSVTRYLGFQGTIPDHGTFEFLGIEVDRIGRIPEGMVAWELKDARLSILAEKAGEVHRIAEAHASWDWLDETSGAPRPWTGEISLSGDPMMPPLHLALTSISWVSLPPDNPASDDVVIQEYDPTWPSRYEEFKQWLLETIGADVVLGIEHYGSTAIPGMPAKPVIDVLVEVPDFNLAKRHMLPRLNRPEWEYWWYVDHPVFIRRSRLMGDRTHHVHVAVKDHRLWEGIAFRDHLRTHPAQAAEYAVLKRTCAARNRTDRERYTDEKAAFVRRIVAEASARP